MSLYFLVSNKNRFLISNFKLLLWTNVDLLYDRILNEFLDLDQKKKLEKNSFIELQFVSKANIYLILVYFEEAKEHCLTK